MLTVAVEEVSLGGRWAVSAFQVEWAGGFVGSGGGAVIGYLDMPKRNIENVFAVGEIPDGTQEGCVFCSAEARRGAVACLGSVFAIPDARPVSDGHVLVVPMRHVEDCFDLTPLELRDANALLALLRERILRDDLSVTGFNVGVNCGVSAGQQIMHAHIHFIPRRGDEPIKGVIRNKLSY